MLFLEQYIKKEIKDISINTSRYEKERILLILSCSSFETKLASMIILKS